VFKFWFGLVMFQHLAIANSHGWHRFLHRVDQVLPRRGTPYIFRLENRTRITKRSSTEGASFLAEQLARRVVNEVRLGTGRTHQGCVAVSGIFWCISQPMLHVHPGLGTSKENGLGHGGSMPTPCAQQNSVSLLRYQGAVGSIRT
jgi:hypothetical protein